MLHSHYFTTKIYISIPHVDHGVTASKERMASTSVGRRLVACLLNISEARRKDLVETVAKAALYDPKGVRREGTTVLNIFNDHDYNRSVITIVSAIDSIREAVLSACEKACSLIDMRAHSGGHPCLGAVDLIPLYPLGEDVLPQDCASEARGVWYHGVPVSLGLCVLSAGVGLEES
uniref:Formiminotransferase N-terminal subdomain domain-containing protein n=1 Tax=Knipowitschia caucasica TaxID=637954 RepID=A0AAV2JYD7_KNICA